MECNIHTFKIKVFKIKCRIKCFNVVYIVTLLKQTTSSKYNLKTIRESCTS